MTETEQLARRLRALAVFRPLLQDAAVAALIAVLEGARADPGSYGALAAALYPHGGDLGAYLLGRVSDCETPVLHMAAQGKALPQPLADAQAAELELFRELSALCFDFEPGLPTWTNTPQDFAAGYAARLAAIHTRGFGVFAGHHMFTLGQAGGLHPVRNPDPQRLAELTGYEREREKILINTRALLGGLPANNILLYGDAGTGKSSTVKALANEYREAGLRLVEVRKNQLYAIPDLMDRLAENPLKFILFIDDLSFPADDGDFTALKAILEGNVAARPANIVVYATSNRRHMMKENYSDRIGDDLHRGDTLEEQASLSARFGLTVTFLKPDRELYADIVLAVAKELGVRASPEELVKRAEAHAIRHGGRSPRTARQFAELQLAEERMGEG